MHTAKEKGSMGEKCVHVDPLITLHSKLLSRLLMSCTYATCAICMGTALLEMNGIIVWSMG